jgi:hypothetical protein
LQCAIAARAPLRQRASRAVESSQSAGSAAGRIRGDVAALDLLTILNGLSFATDDPAQTERLLDLLLDGLRTRSEPAADPGRTAGNSA